MDRWLRALALNGGQGGTSSTTKGSVASTAGESWSGSFERLEASVNGTPAAVNLKPISESKQIVFFGSSTIKGQGATSGNSFTGLLNNALIPLGYKCHNRGVGGNSTADGIARFFKDVAPQNADFIILGFTLGNEGFHDATTDAQRTAICRTFVANMLKLVNMAKQQGMTPIVAYQMPTGRYDAAHYRYARQVNAEFDALGFHCIDWLGAVIDPDTMQPIASAVSDISHVNNAGHRALFKSFPISALEKINYYPGGLIQPPRGYIHTGDLATAEPLTFTPQNSVESYSVFVRFKLNEAMTGAVSIIASNGGAERVFVEANGGLKFWQTGDAASVQIAAAGTIVTDKWYSLAQTYNHISKRIDVYLDGVSIHSVTGGTGTGLGTLIIGGRTGATAYLKNANLKDVLVYRTKLIEDQIKLLHEGVISQTSLELYAPLNDKVTAAGTPLLNLAATTSYLSVGAAATTITPVIAPAVI